MSILLLIAVLLTAPARAAEGAAAAAPVAPAESPSKTSDAAVEAPETKPVVKPESKPESKPEVPVEAKTESKPEAKPEIKEEKSVDDELRRPIPSKDKTLLAPAHEAKPVEPTLNVCAAKLKPVADAYTKAHDDILVWLREASGKLDAAEGRVGALKKQIADKEAQITQLKLESSKKNDAQMRVLDQESRALWSQLKTEESKRKDLCRALAIATGQKVRDLNRGVLDQLEKSADEATGR
jgi:outer membrane biosynthesis protein TonB